MSHGKKFARISDADIEACKTAQATVLAMQLTGLIAADGTATCPKCGDAGLKLGAGAQSGKLKVQNDGNIKHWSGNGCFIPAPGIDLLKAPKTELVTGPDGKKIQQPVPARHLHPGIVPLGLSFPDAVRALTGQETSVPLPEVPELHLTLRAQSQNRPDPEVYAGLLRYAQRTGGTEAAVKFYGEFHISEEVVRDSRAVYISDVTSLEKAIVAKYGHERLLACGLFTTVVDQKTQEPVPRFLISRSHPVLEPAFNVSGHVVNMQFRGSHATAAKVAAHKNATTEAEKAANPYVSKFFNLKGINPGLVNLDRVSALPAGSTVELVEGFKDRLAAATCGQTAVAFPGIGYTPTAGEVEVLKPFKLRLRFDDDEAGKRAMYGVDTLDAEGNVISHQAGWLEKLTSQGLEVVADPFADGLDYTDTLVANWAYHGQCRAHEACRKMANRYGVA